MTEVYLKLVAALLISVGLLRFTNWVAPAYYTLRFISGYYTFQFVVITGYLIILPDAQIWNNDGSTLFIRDCINRTIVGYLALQIAVLLAACAGSLMFKSPQQPLSLTALVQQNARRLVGPLMFVAVVVMTYPLLRKQPVLGYISAILFNFMNFIPFLAGLLYFHHRGLRTVWLVALTVIFALGILTGGRGVAITSAAMYAFGFYQALETRRARRRAIVAGAVLAVPMLIFMSFVGIYRNIVGRVDFDKITWERAVRVYEKYQKVKDSKVLQLDSDEGKEQGLGRLINFVNLNQFATVPEKRPRLGFEGLSSDFYYSFDIAFLSNTTLDERLRARAGNFRMNDYGYWVSKVTSVEYSIVTEGFIRFGYLGIFVGSSLMAFFGLLMEFLIRLFSRKQPAFQAFCIVMLCQQALLSYVYNVFPVMRNMVLSIVAAALLLSFVALFRILFWGQKIHRSPVPT